MCVSQDTHRASPVWMNLLFFFSSRRRHTRCLSDWSSDVCSSDLEQHYRDVQDIEFTVEEGRLYLLQTRSAKRTAAAALKAAADMTSEGLIDREEAVSRIDPHQIGRASCRERG